MAAGRGWWKGFSQVRTVYRRVSSACGEAARAMSGNHPGSRSYLYLGAEVRLGVDQRVDVAEALVAMLQHLRGRHPEQRPHVPVQRLVQGFRGRVVVGARAPV